MKKKNSNGELTVAVLFAGLGGISLGYQRAGFKLVGAIDNDAAACRDHEYLTGVPATCADIATMTPADLREACGGERPDVIATSPPCRGFSGCLPAAMANTPKYEGLNELALRGIWMALEAWETPPPIIVLENVPRIMSRGERWLEISCDLLRAKGYAVAKKATHDLGELGGLAQRRRRFLLVARHMEQVPELLYQPRKKKLLGVGEVLGALPQPTPGVSEESGGGMHWLNKMSPLNWVRLALIPAGGDWRNLPESVALAHRAARQNGGYGINDWDGQAHTVVAANTVRGTWSSVLDPRIPPRDTRHQVADPRLEHEPRTGSWGVTGWAEPSHTVIASVQPDKGFNVADPRPPLIVGHELDISTDGTPTHIVIRAADGTWHRPLTTLELAVLQGLPPKVNGKWLKLDGRAQVGWRQRIGNAVPPPAAEAVAREMRRTLEASRADELLMCSRPVWVEGHQDEATH